MDDKESWRTYLLASVCRQAERREIDGVEFDLSHKDLDRDEWEPTTILGSLRLADLYTPRLLFPWASDRERQIFEQRGQGIEVHKGDAVRVAAVRRMSVKAEHGDLDHPHHRERRWAELVVLRGSGTKLAVGQAWEFQGVEDVMTPIARRDYKQAKWALLARLSDALGLESIDDIQLAGSPAEWPKFADTATGMDRLAAQVLWDADNECIDEAAMVFGYLIGRAEARELLLPFAERRIELRNQRLRASKQPRKGGEETRGAALLVIADNVEITKHKCAERVASMRDLKDVKGVERTIANFFQKGAGGKLRPTPAAIAAAKAQVTKGI